MAKSKMAKSKSGKRKLISLPSLPNKVQKTSPAAVADAITPPPTDTDSVAIEPKSISTLVSEEELEITIETLQALTAYPNLIKSKACKDLRVAIYDFKQACTTGVLTAGEEANLTSRISAALVDGKLVEARILLAEMKVRGEQPKLGALCRWVRDLDVVSGLSAHVDGISKATERSAEERELLVVLDAILRVTGPTDNSSRVESGEEPIVLQELWNLRDAEVTEEVYCKVLDRSLIPNPEAVTRKFKIIETTPALQRRPPNHHPAVLYTSEDNAINLASPGPVRSRHAHPIVPNLALIKNVLSPAECKEIIAAGEAVEFIPDAPVRDDGGEVSVLAHNFYWVVDPAFHDRLWDRVKEYVPASVGGKMARGLNRRFRVYRYVPGAEYRCHIDGAWPPSGITPAGVYQYDSSPPTKRQSSLFTFLIYLNDDFEAGETTFFLPSVKEGTMNAYPVKPVMGSVAMFPHGETNGALLHEGTGVRKGAKYVIRTDVEYDVDAGDE